MRSLAAMTALATALVLQAPRDWRLEVTQLTRGPMHHFFGYIGHARNIPWNGDGRYILALRTAFQDRMPKPGEPADVVVIDTRQGNRIEPIEHSRGWNPQQGTMFYWNPHAPATQFFFNDRDPLTQKVFTVLYDVAARKRVREYRFDDTPVANSGVAQQGGRFLALNYGRLARLRPVTGYPGAHDFTGDTLHPPDDGIHVVDVAGGTRRLLVSYAQLADLIRPVRPDVDRKRSSSITRSGAATTTASTSTSGASSTIVPRGSTYPAPSGLTARGSRCIRTSADIPSGSPLSG